jgi:nicotinamide-nucleotide amidase
VGRTAVIAVGDELVSGSVIESNGALLALAIAGLGMQVDEIRVVRDDEDALARAMQELAESFPVVFVTGGLGPTLDDVTRHAAARAAGVELVLSELALYEVAYWWKGRDREMPATNERQALLPVGADRMPNRVGTAPGFRLALGASTLVVLPGPPREVTDMLEAQVLPWLRETFGSAPVARAEFHLFDLSESVFAERVGDWMARGANPEIGVTASRGVLSVRMRAVGASEDAARSVLDARADAFRERFADHLFSEVDADPEIALGRVLLERGVSFTVAESCTGGGVAARLTRVPGISDVFADAFVTYSNDAKTRRLGVAPDLIEREGAVSSAVAAEMARGAARMSGARLALSVTGIAGPDGGGDEKPVGLVWFGVSVDGEVDTVSHCFPAHSRDWVRDLATRTALLLAWTRVPGGRPEPERPAGGRPR